MRKNSGHWKTNLRILTDKGKVTKHSINVVDYILSTIKNQTIIYKKDWCLLNQQVLGKYNTFLLRSLLKSGYIVTDGVYHKNTKCLGYRINMDKIDEIGFKDRKKPNPIHKKINDRLLNWGVNKLNDKNLIVREYTLELFSKNRVKLNSDYKKVLNQIKIEDELNKTDKYNNNYYMTEMINSGEWFLTFDKNQNRFYTPLHGLSSQIYKNIMIDNELLVEIDLSASFYQSLIIMASERKIKLDDSFINDIINGDFYQKLNIKNIDKNEFKKRCLAWLMSSPFQKENIYTDINELFMLKYPKVYNFVKNVNDIYIPLNRIESTCFKDLSIILFDE